MTKIIGQSTQDVMHKDDVMSLAVIDGNIFSGSFDGVINKWSSDLKLIESWQAHQYAVYSLAGNSYSLFSSSSGGEIKEWDTKSCHQKTAILMESPSDRKTGEVKTLFLHQDLLIAGDDKGVMTIYKPNFEVDSQKFLYVDIWSLVVSPDGSNVFAAKDNECIIADFSQKFKNEMFATTLSVRTTISGRAPVAVDNNTVVIIDRSGMTINVYKNGVSQFPLVESLKDGHDMIINAIVLDGKNVVSSGWDGKVVMWDIQSGKKVNELCWDNYVNTMAWLDAEKKTLVVGGKSGNLILVQF